MAPGCHRWMLHAKAALVRCDQEVNPPKVPKGLKAFVDDMEVVRARGRLVAGEVSAATATPMVLVPGALAVEMATECHHDLLHCPACQVLHHLHAAEGIMIIRVK